MDQEERPNPLGDRLRRLRASKRLSLRDVEAENGVSSSYLSQIEQGKRHAGPDVLRRIAPTYGATVRELLLLGGYLDEPEVLMSDQERLDWAFTCVVTDPEYRFGTSLRTAELTYEAKRFIVEVYEKATGRSLL